MTQLELGKVLKEQGQALVEEHNQDFVSRMREVALVMVQKNGTVTSDDLREYAARVGIEPAHCNAWGCIFSGPGWRSVGFIRSRLPQSHARTIRIWTFSE